MSADPFRHSLVHVFLEEELGGKEAPDLSQAILGKALGEADSGGVSIEAIGSASRRRTWPRWYIPAAAAAAVLIAVTAWMLIPAGYPDMTISGDYQIASGNELQRGAEIRTEEGSAVLELGVYCQVELKPWTTLRVNGSDYKEELFVDVGMIVCSVDSKVGQFGVVSELGSARVKGTKFTVRVEEFGGLRQMRVTVAEGAVEVRGGSIDEILQAGGQRTIIGSEPRRPETAPATKPKDKTDANIVIDPIDPGDNSEFSSASDDDLPALRRKIIAAQERVEQIENEIRRLNEENRFMRKELENRGDPAENTEHQRFKTESPNNE